MKRSARSFDVAALRRNYVENKYIHLLAVIFIIFLISPHIDGWRPEIPAVTTVFILSLFFILRALKFGAKVLVTAGAACLVLFVLQTAVNIFAASGVAMPVMAVLCLVFSLFLMACILRMVYTIFRSRAITVDTIAGGIAVFFLLGFLWTFIYYFIYIVDRHAFHFPTQPSTTSFIYYSFITLTTVGYGDIYPVNKWAMIFASLEGVVGQLYVAVFIARLVGLYAMGQRERLSD